jgi:transposase
MRELGFFKHIYLAKQPADFRKQAHGLVLLVRQKMDMNPLTYRSLFLFTNKRKNALKALYWDETGFALWSKVLEKERFHWPEFLAQKLHIELSTRQLRWLLDGIDLRKIKMHKGLFLG